MKISKPICVMLLIISLALLASCGKAGVADETASFYVDIVNKASDEIYTVNYKYFLNDRACGSGACGNADGTALRKGDVLSKEFLPADFPDGMELSDFSMSVAVTLEDGAEVKCRGDVDFSPEYGRHYVYVLSGSASAGFFLSYNAES